MPHILIIAYGNPLRSDDGVAWRAADALQGKFPKKNVEILRLHQLAPELAETVRRFACVIFIDAGASAGNEPGHIACEEISPSAAETRFSHQFSPAAVLALAAQLYGSCPKAYSVTITGENFNHGETLSAAVEQSLPAFVARIAELIEAELPKANS